MANVGTVNHDFQWKIVDSTPFELAHDFDWEIEFAVPDPDSFLVVGTARLATRMRISTEGGRYP